MRWLVLMYGLLAAAMFAAIATYLPLFLAYHVVPQPWRKPIYTYVIGDRYLPAVDGEIFDRSDDALVMNLSLLAAFAVPHSLMARQGFKRIWTKIVPQPIERSTYVIIAALLLAALLWFWKPIPELIWPTEASVAASGNPEYRTPFQVAFWTGWTITVLSSLMVAPGELTGLRQTWLYFRGRPYTPPPLRTPWFYRFVRHPSMLGLLIAFWSTPVMTIGHMLFAGAMSVYIVVGVLLEERDLVALYGEAYRQYQRRASMFLPLRFRRGA